jgi:sensor histidine kinase regulating citrate/malate metabolism
VFLSGLAAMNMIGFILYDELAKRSKLMIEKEQENLRLEAENHRYNAMIAYVDESHSFMHDIKGHLKNILSLTEEKNYTEAAAYIRKLDIEVTEMYEHHILPQYPAVDTVLRQRTVEARKCGVKLECNITVPNGMPIDPIDLCIILGNALDNAVEACVKLGGETSIIFEMFLTGNRLMMKITNPSTPVNIEDNKCETTKGNTAKHGYGLSNMEKTIKKYNGNMYINYDSE